MNDINEKLLAACEALAKRCDDNSWSDIFIAITAARAQAEDDAKPVNEKWLESIGFVADTAAFVTFTLHQIKCWRVGVTNRVEWQWRCGLSVIREQKTRGDVRRLLVALGVK